MTIYKINTKKLANFSRKQNRKVTSTLLADNQECMILLNLMTTQSHVDEAKAIFRFKAGKALCLSSSSFSFTGSCSSLAYCWGSFSCF